VSEAYLEYGTKKEVAYKQGAEVEGEALAEGCGATVGEFLNDRCKRQGAAFRVACEPRSLRV
jgi:hypothetical protein